MSNENKIRFRIIARHAIMYCLTLDKRHKYEIYHYWYITIFTDIKD